MDNYAVSDGHLLERLICMRHRTDIFQMLRLSYAAGAKGNSMFLSTPIFFGESRFGRAYRPPASGSVHEFLLLNAAGDRS